jgi:Uma2 family endonuclease
MAVAMLHPTEELTLELEAAPKLVTGEELAEMVHHGRVELIEGVVIEMPPPGYIHGLIEFEIGRLLGNFVREHRLGYVLGGETGFYIRRQPDTVRAVDVAFISHERLAAGTEDPYLSRLPELIVEVVSPHDRWRDVTEKVQAYFTAGALQVWLVEPERRLVYLYTSPTQTSILGVAESISDIPFLPGLIIPVADIFAVLPK